MNGEVALYELLKNDANFYSLLSLVDGNPALSIGIVEPTSWGINDTTASIYNAVGVPDADTALFTELTVSCRAPTERGAKELGKACVAAVNLTRVVGGQFYTFTGGIIRPEDPENDAYNLPITVTVRAVKELN